MQELLHEGCKRYLKKTRGEGGLWPPSTLVWATGVTFKSSEEVVLSEFVDLSVIFIQD